MCLMMFLFRYLSILLIMILFCFHNYSISSGIYGGIFHQVILKPSIIEKSNRYVSVLPFSLYARQKYFRVLLCINNATDSLPLIFICHDH